jgi:glycosyltransferase involved in cell wall biosynthesis/GT2 family glycosyltransferase
MVRFYVSPETNQALNSAGARRIVLFAGGYNGYYMNFGDLLQLRGVLRWHRKEDRNSLLCPTLHLSPIPDKKFVDELTAFFGTPYWIFYAHEEENADNQIRKLGLEPLRLSSSLPSIILHVYGGGFFNGFWGHWMLKMIESILLTFPIEHYVISGQQVAEEFGSALAEHCQRYRPELIGCRDPISVEVLSENGVDAVFSGDDAFEELSNCVEGLNRPSLEKENTFGLQLNFSSYVYLPSSQAEQNRPAQLQDALLEELEKLLTLLVAKFGTASVPILVDSYLTPRPEVQNTWVSIKQSLLTKYFPRFIGVDLVSFLLQEKLLEAASILRTVSLFVASSYHTAFFAKMIGIPTFLIAFNEYYSQKRSGIEIKRRTFEEFLNEPRNIITKEQDEIIQSHKEARTKWLAKVKEVLGSTNVKTTAVRMTAYYQETSRRLQEELDEKDRIIQGLRSEIELKEIQIERLQEEAVKRQTELQEWQERFYAQQNRCAQLQEELQRLLRSKSLRITAPLRRMYKHLIAMKMYLKIRAILLAKRILPPRLKKAVKRILGWERKKEIVPISYPVKKFKQKLWPEDRPLVSVVIPCYNYGKFVEEAIDSVLNQTLQSFEIIVVNDGSTDPATNELLNRLQKPKTVVIHQTNRGLPAARNRGIQHARGKYICCLDADDTLEPTYLEKAVSLLEANPGVAFAYSWVRLFGDEQGIWYTEPFNLEKLLKYNHISVAGVFRYDAWKSVGGYREEMRQGYEDWEFWIRVGAHGMRGQLIPEPLFNHRRHGRTMTHSAQEKHKELVSYIVRCHRELFENSKHLKEIQLRYFDGLVDRPFLNLCKSEIFLQCQKELLLFLVPWLTIGGAETMLYEIIDQLKEKFVFCIVTTVPSKNEWHDRFYKLTPLIYHLPNFLPEYAWKEFLINFIITRNVKKILISGSEFAYSCLPELKAKVPKLHVINLLHNDSELGYFRHSIINDPYIDVHITVNKAISKKLCEIGHINPSKIHVIYNGIDAENLFNPTRYEAKSIRKRYGVPDDKKVVTYIGRLSPEKQPGHFLELAARLKERGDVVFVLVGDGPLSDFVKTEIDKLKLGDFLHWYKTLPYEQIPEILTLSDVLVLSSEVEGLPMTILEALAMGVPVVSYDVGEIRFLIQNGINGFIVPPQQLDLLTKIVAQLLSDKNLLQWCKHHARESLLQRGLTRERMANEYEAIFKL